MNFEDYKSQAEKMVTYFQEVATVDPERGEKGLHLAIHWRNLVFASQPDPADVENLLINLAEAPDKGTALHEVLLLARKWAQSLPVHATNR